MMPELRAHLDALKTLHLATASPATCCSGITTYAPFEELLGHSDVRTTMIYTHTVKSVTIKDALSPLDF